MSENFQNNEYAGVNQPAKNVLQNVDTLIKLDKDLDTIATTEQLDEQIDRTTKALELTQEKNSETIKATQKTLTQLEGIAQSFNASPKYANLINKIQTLRTNITVIQNQKNTVDSSPIESTSRTNGYEGKKATPDFSQGKPTPQFKTEKTPQENVRPSSTQLEAAKQYNNMSTASNAGSSKNSSSSAGSSEGRSMR
ncbi:MAG: hypothetical protein ACK4NC_00575 [Candidatus Gracilibacteria bacterium]